MGKINKEKDVKKINRIPITVDDTDIYTSEEYTSFFAQSIFDGIDYLIRDFLEFLGGIFLSEDVSDQIERYANHNIVYSIIPLDQKKYLTNIFNTCKILLAARNSSIISLGYDLSQLEKSFGTSVCDVFYKILDSNSFLAAINGNIDSIKKINDILMLEYYCEDVSNPIDTNADTNNKPIDVTNQIAEKFVDTVGEQQSINLDSKVEVKNAEDTKEPVAG
jgi:hypothetical protein